LPEILDTARNAEFATDSRGVLRFSQVTNGAIELRSAAVITAEAPRRNNRTLVLAIPWY